MKISWIKKENSPNLIIFFGGFACDENLLKPFGFGESDVAMFYDYSGLEADVPQEFFEYSRVDVAAWSFGVWVADFMKDRLPQARTRIAICGSTSPVHDSLGIPRGIFEGTAANFSESSREKFLLRVFGAANFKACKNLLAARSVKEEKAELQNLGEKFGAFRASPENWTRAIAAKNDKIFPLANLKNVWGDKLEVVAGEHFPLSLFQCGIEKLFADAREVGKSFEKSFAIYEKSARVQKRIAERLAHLTLKRVNAGEVKSVLEIGVGTGFLTEILASEIKNAHWYLNDLSARSIDYVRGIFETPPTFIAGDAQIQELPANMDLIVSSSCFQWFDSLGDFIERLAKISSKNAVMAFSTFLPDNFREIRALTGKGLNYVGIVGIEAMIKRAGFELLCAEAETIKLNFKKPADVLRHLRDTGVTGTFAEFWTPSKMKAFSRQYTDFFSDAGGVSLTYRPAYFVAKYKGLEG
ncbi:MAG: malonyl-ACP O-methyltransferase BioC [Opitutales bacterium]|nr:malonyl-ACP O-methyltransferase BioC [Opitutales bacterium]